VPTILLAKREGCRAEAPWRRRAVSASCGSASLSPTTRAPPSAVRLALCWRHRRPKAEAAAGTGIDDVLKCGNYELLADRGIYVERSVRLSSARHPGWRGRAACNVAAEITRRQDERLPPDSPRVLTTRSSWLQGRCPFRKRLE
jgi:hypothetical protein